MRISILLLAVIIFSSCFSNQEKKWVFDYEGDLKPAEIKRFDSLFNSHERKTSNEIILVTTPDYGTDTSIVMYALHFGRMNGVGKKGIDNGIVIVMSKAKRQVRISTGYGTERVLQDAMAQEIIDSAIIPKFKQDSIFAGLWNGSMRIVSFLERPENTIK